MYSMKLYRYHYYSADAIVDRNVTESLTGQLATGHKHYWSNQPPVLKTSDEWLRVAVSDNTEMFCDYFMFQSLR